MSRVRMVVWVLAVAMMMFGLVSLLFTGWCVDHGVEFPDRGRWIGSNGVTTRGEVIWQGVCYLLLGFLLGPVTSFSAWFDRRRAGNREWVRRSEAGRH
ncbi:hypothetical protein [Nocardioides sp. CER19]|uniref:hypothetical protein n=1 Tax=Nocardioides sp. CER19 TaxID=3038538 RepID=UPI00244942CE|nr:hypothetical protein [Nocardioides sp. CER19]MDH2412671.1 hypothetical protein [Nocardioides sp. CER19]